MKIDLSEKLWQTSWAVTGFAIAQAVAYLYALEKPGICTPMHNGLIWSIPVIVIFHSIYLLAIQWCFGQIAKLDTTSDISIEEKTILSRIKLGQQITVASFGILACTITLLTCCSKNAS